MTSLLVPSYSLTMGSQRWTEQLLGLEVKLEAAPLLNALTVRLPAAAPVKAVIGDPVELTLDSGEKSGRVFTGALESMQRTLSEVRITALDGSARLAQFRPAVTFEGVTVGTLVRKLCGEVGVDVGSVEDGGTLAFYAADPSRTALDHLARVCAWIGALARVNGGNAFESSVMKGTSAEVALKYGRELVAITQGQLRSTVEAFVIAGESGAGSSSEPTALRLTTDFFGGTVQTARTGPPSGVSSRLYARSSRPRRRARLHCGSTSLVANEEASKRFCSQIYGPGLVLEIQDLPAGINGGPLWITAVSHRLTPAGAWTRARYYQGGSSFDPAALLGSLLGSLF